MRSRGRVILEYLPVRDDSCTNGKNYLPIVEINAETLHLYRSRGSGIAKISLNPLIDVVDAAFATGKVNGRRTLGGLVSHVWIDGKIVKDPASRTSH